jgi:hypothetical protein
LAWQDRDYYRGGGGAGDYLSNPAAILGLSVPFGTWLGVRVRLHFWLLVTAAICIASVLNGVRFVVAVLYLLLLLVALMLHDFGHRLFAQWAGGQLDEFMLWPAGGLIFPTMPSGARPMFVGHVGGMVVNALLAGGSIGLLALHGYSFPIILNPLAGLGGPMFPSDLSEALFIDALFIFAQINCGLVLVNLLPYYWFDGGYLLQSIFWPFLGGNSALNVTCIIGMILAVPMFVLALTQGSLLGMVMWVLLFSSSYTARTSMQVVEDYPLTESVPRHRWQNRNLAREAARRRREEAKIDAILAKVSAHGMHSLTWWEKRTLRKGSQRRD